MLKKVLLTTLLISFGALAQDKSVLTVDCSVEGLSYHSLKQQKTNNEKLIYETGETKGGYKFSKTEFFVDKKKVESKVISAEDNYLISSLSQEVGKGFSRKIYVFINFYDFQANEVTRQVTVFPDGTNEKTKGKCIVNNARK